MRPLNLSPTPLGAAPVGSAQQRTTHTSPASALLAILPDPSAANAPCRAGGSGLSFNDQRVAHAAAGISQVQQ